MALHTTLTNGTRLRFYRAPAPDGTRIIAVFPATATGDPTTRLVYVPGEGEPYQEVHRGYVRGLRPASDEDPLEVARARHLTRQINADMEAIA